MASFWYIRGANQDPNQPESYTRTDGTPSCAGVSHVCSVFSTEQFISGVSRPVIDQALISEMTEALNQEGNTQNVKLRSSQ